MGARTKTPDVVLSYATHSKISGAGKRFAVALTNILESAGTPPFAYRS